MGNSSHLYSGKTMRFFSMVISQNSLSNMTTNCANCDYSAINGSKIIHNVEGVKINFAGLFLSPLKLLHGTRPTANTNSCCPSIEAVTR